MSPRHPDSPAERLKRGEAPLGERPSADAVHVAATVKRGGWVEYDCGHDAIEQAVAAGLVERTERPDRGRTDRSDWRLTTAGQEALDGETEVERLRRRVRELEDKLDECEDAVANATGGYGP